MERYAKQAYISYSASAGNKNFRGEPMPDWDDLPEEIRQHWRAAVGAVLAMNEDEDGSSEFVEDYMLHPDKKLNNHYISPRKTIVLLNAREGEFASFYDLDEKRGGYALDGLERQFANLVQAGYLRGQFAEGYGGADRLEYERTPLGTNLVRALIPLLEVSQK